jgi:hypothetical protein
VDANRVTEYSKCEVEQRRYALVRGEGGRKGHYCIFTIMTLGGRTVDGRGWRKWRVWSAEGRLGMPPLSESRKAKAESEVFASSKAEVEPRDITVMTLG